MDARTKFALKCAAAMTCGVLIGGFGIFGAAWAFIGVHIAKKQLDAEELDEIHARLATVGIGPVQLLQILAYRQAHLEQETAEYEECCSDPGSHAPFCEHEPDFHATDCALCEQEEAALSEDDFPF